MTDSEYARHRAALGLPGTTRQAVAKAKAAGRLRRSLGADGTIGDAELADAEWRANTDPSKGPELRPARRDRLTSTAAVAEIEGRLREIMAADYDDTKRRALALIAPLVAGAVEELRTGGRASAAALAAALRLDDPTDDDAGIEVLGAVGEIVEFGSADPVEAARAAGREIASGRWWRRQEEDHGDE